MSAGVKITAKIDSVQRIAARRKLEKDGQAQRFFTHQFRRMADPYVPKKEGILKNTAQESTSSITYVQLYASRNYYSNRGMGKQGTAKGGRRGKLWDKRMWADHGQELVDGVAAYVGGKSKK